MRGKNRAGKREMIRLKRSGRRGKMNQNYRVLFLLAVGALIQVSCTSNAPNSGATGSPAAVNAKERMERVREILSDRPTGPEDLGKLRAELSIVAASDAPEKSRAVESLKLLENLEQQMPTGEALNQTKRMCQELSETSIDTLKQAMSKTLAKSASLQELQVEKCAPNGVKGDSVNVRAAFKMKTGTGEIVADREMFVVITGDQGGPKYKATVKSN
jgi:hypothetical protein